MGWLFHLGVMVHIINLIPVSLTKAEVFPSLLSINARSNVRITYTFKGIWAGMIFGGTAFQTVVLAIITSRCDWEKEVS